MTGTAWIAFVAAAAIGAPARYLVEGIVQQRARGRFPWGTLAVNVSGCFLLGVLTGLGLYHGLGATSRLVLGTGGLGAYTTFSTFTFQSVSLLEQRFTRPAAANVAGSFVLGLAAASAGLALTAVL
ncbi:MAG TPA: CrcB family protein [Ilumatobacteraceae bacterium]|jgi:CrcB protein|nr:CrcB family protein [Ilumatobacteraceae bacterium]